MCHVETVILLKRIIEKLDSLSVPLVPSQYVPSDPETERFRYDFGLTSVCQVPVDHPPVHLENGGHIKSIWCGKTVPCEIHGLISTRTLGS